MTARTIHTLTLSIAAAAACFGTGAMAQVPAAVAAPGETTVATVQAEGAQIYQCKAGNDGKLTWVFREPIATLILNDKTGVSTTFRKPGGPPKSGAALCITERQNSIGDARTDPRIVAAGNTTNSR